MTESALNTLLLTSSKPGHRNVEEVFLAEMLDCIPRDTVFWAALTPAIDPEVEQNDRLAGFKQLLAQKEHFPHDPRAWTRFNVLLHQFTRYRYAVRKLTHVTSQLVAVQSPHQLWTVLSSLSVIDVAWGLSKTLQIPTLVQVWDDPLHLLRERRMDHLTRTRTMRHFFELLERADRVAVIGESMQATYAKYTKEQPIIIRHGLNAVVKSEFKPGASTEFRIGFCGAMYARSAWKCLERALESLEWKLSGRNVVLEVASPEIAFTAERPAMVRYHGWQTKCSSARESVDRAVGLMSNCDLLYLPQAFEPVSRPLTELSFPTKLSTYVSTGCPILVHTPDYGSLNDFCRTHDFGVVCNELNVKSMADLLVGIANNPIKMQELARGTIRIATDVLSRQNFRNSVREFLSPDLVEADEAVLDLASNAL